MNTTTTKPQSTYLLKAINNALGIKDPWKKKKNLLIVWWKVSFLLAINQIQAPKALEKENPKQLSLMSVLAFFRVKTIDSEYYWAMNEIFLCVA